VIIVMYSACYDRATDGLALQTMYLDSGSLKPGMRSRVLFQLLEIWPAIIDSALQLRQPIYKASFRYWWA